MELLVTAERLLCDWRLYPRLCRLLLLLESALCVAIVLRVPCESRACAPLLPARGGRCALPPKRGRRRPGGSLSCL